MATFPEVIGQRSETVRRANLSAIAGELHLRGPLSRSALVSRTGLTRSAIRGHVGQFAAAGLVTEEPSESLGMPGRPSPIVRPNPEQAVVLALAIGVDSIAAATVGFGGTVLDLVRVERPRGHLSVDEVATDLAAVARPLLREHLARGTLIGSALAVAGVVRRDDGFVVIAPNLGWHEVALGDRMARELGLPTTTLVANEADLGALAEQRRGAAIGADDLVYIFGEVGVGGGVIIGGQQLAGAAGYGGEVGHLPVNPNGSACGCGSVGCWETEIGERALLRRAGSDPDGGPEEVEALLQDAVAGSEQAIGALREVGRWLGVGIAGLVNLFNPRLVVLGGLFHRTYPFVAPALESELGRLALPASRSVVRVVPSMLGQNAPLVGAAEVAFDEFLSDPARWLDGDRALAVASA